MSGTIYERPIGDCLNESVSCLQSEGCDASQKIPVFSLESVIEENPHLTGPEAIKLYKAELETISLQQKNEIIGQLKDLNSKLPVYFRVREYEANILMKVKEYKEEYGEIQMVFDSLKLDYRKQYAHDSAIKFKADDDMSLSYFNTKQENTDVIEEDVYNRALRTYGDLKNFLS